MNIVLIGYRGSGKSTVGKSLAERLDMRLVDTDHLIEERQGNQIAEIVRLHGWDGFREMERKIISEVSNDDHLIIAAGGGAVLEPENVKDLKKNGFIIWLKGNVPILFQRMARDLRTATGRPSLTGRGTLKELEEVTAYRMPFYEKASEVQVDTSALGVDEVVERILAIFRKKEKGLYQNGRIE
jgi:shikimate kinase